MLNNSTNIEYLIALSYVVFLMFIQKYIKLSELSWDEFITEGFIVQRPMTQTLVLGHGRVEKGEVKVSFLSFYGKLIDSFYPEYIAEVSIEEFHQFIQKEHDFNFSLNKYEDFDCRFLDDAKTIINNIKSDDVLAKLVGVTRAVYLNKENKHPLLGLNDFYKYPQASLYGIWKTSKGILGFSPEPLFINEGGGFHTKALAGTISTAISNFKKVILNDSKEREEHQLVIDDISLKIKDFGKVTKVGETSVVEFGKIAHLQTPIEFDVSEGFSSEKMAKKLSPTAALGGFPSTLAYDQLRDLNYYQIEKENREFGGVMLLEKGTDSFGLVAIRNIQWDKNFYYIDSGCGIVGASDANKELLEVQKKRKTIEDLFNAKDK